MAITIKGIRIESITCQRNKETETVELTGASYSLISSMDKVLANQAIGGYGGVIVTPSTQTLKLFEQFIQSYKQDVTETLGLTE